MIQAAHSTHRAHRTYPTFPLVSFIFERHRRVLDSVVFKLQSVVQKTHSGRQSDVSPLKMFKGVFLTNFVKQRFMLG